MTRKYVGAVVTLRTPYHRKKPWKEPRIEAVRFESSGAREGSTATLFFFRKS